MTDEPTTIRPNRRVFIWRPILRRALLFGLLALAGYFFIPLFAAVDVGLATSLGAAAMLVVLYGVNRWITYTLTFYEFHDDRLVIKTGSIVTRGTIDLPYRNVTQVMLRLPFIERKLFGTGHLEVHAAGSTQGTARLESVDDPHQLYDRIADHLRDNGFGLERNEQLQREKPHIIGTAIDTSGMALGGLIALLTIGLTVGGTVIELMQLQSYYELWDVLIGTVDAEDVEQDDAAFRATLGLAVLAVLAATAGIAKLAIHFVDLNRRTYTLFDDVVDYEDGFLTETYKFVPIENLADTATEVPFLKRLFGMADVTLSPHGSASGIRFPSMPRAATFRQHLDRLIEKTDGPERVEPPTDIDGEPGEPGEPIEAPPESATRSRLPDIDAAPLDFGPSYIRRSITAVGNVLKLLAMLAVLAAVGLVAAQLAAEDLGLEELDIPLEPEALELSAVGFLFMIAVVFVWQLGKAVFFCATTDYRVGRRKMSWERDFISRDEIEFTTDKITTLLVERDWVDRIMGTATITFWSIGNRTPLVFADVGRAQTKIDEIRLRLGMATPIEQAEKADRPRVNPLDVVMGRLYTMIFFVLAAVGAAVGSIWWEPAIWGVALFAALPLLRLIRDMVYYPFCRMWWFEDHIRIRKGIIFRTDIYLPYDQTRSVATTRYPGRSRGTLQLVPGSAGRVSLRYLDDIRGLHEELDDRLYERPMRPVRQPETLDRSVVSERTPLARNSILVAGVFTLSLAVITVIPALLLFLRARRTSIVVEQGRVRRVHGILYRSMQTVLNNRIDQLLRDRGPVHTILRNGVVSVLTVGSSVPQLRLGPVVDEEALYEEIEGRLPGKGSR